MRKKSHIALAGYLMDSMMKEEIVKYKKTFMFGSILPDIIPSFLTRKHTIDATFSILRNEIKKITDEYDAMEGIGRYYVRHLGVVTHYVADYFTLPHNKKFEGNLKDHCVYENELKHRLKEYVTSSEALRPRHNGLICKNADEICQFIQEMHEEYLKAVSAIKTDIDYIVTVCHRIMDAILQLFELKVQSPEFCLA
ncbi:MAG: hypothetical protein E7256_12265 [Lachnospiraceae bacterium]|nr:hypothetical protein [Lachnospiraceae bacterium]